MLQRTPWRAEARLAMRWHAWTIGCRVPWAGIDPSSCCWCPCATSITSSTFKPMGSSPIAQPSAEPNNPAQRTPLSIKPPRCAPAAPSPHTTLPQPSPMPAVIKTSPHRASPRSSAPPTTPRPSTSSVRLLRLPSLLVLIPCHTKTRPCRLCKVSVSPL
jgi:hypothetical protein